MVDTLLSKFVKEFGDFVMQKEVEYLFGSVFVKIIIWSAFIYASGQTLLAFRRGELSRHFPKFMFAWLVCVPVGNIPLGFMLLNNVSTALSYKLEKMTQSLLSTMGKESSLPPGFVYNAIFRAASLEIEDPEISFAIRNLVENCVPDVQIETGQADEVGRRIKKWITPVDLFKGKSTVTSEGQVSYDIPVHLARLLSNRTFNIGSETYNCNAYLEQTRTALANHIKSKNPVLIPENIVLVGSNNGETQHIGINDEKIWTPSSSPTAGNIYRIAANLAQSSAIQKEILRQYFDIDTNRMTASRFLMDKMGTLNPAVDLQTTGKNNNGVSDIITTSVFEYKTILSSLNKFFGLEGAASNGAMLAEINQKMNDFPLFIAGIQLLAKIAFPLVCLSLFYTSRIFKMLSLIWVISLLTPAYINFMRGISNSLHLYLNGLSKTAEGLNRIKETESAYLFYGLNFDASNKLLDDATKLQQTLLTIETFLWGGIFMILPAGIWLNKHGPAMLERMGGAIGRSMSHKIAGEVTEKVTKNLGGKAWKQGFENAGFERGSLRNALGSVGTAATGAAIAGVTFVASKMMKAQTKPVSENDLSSQPTNPGRDKG